MRGWVTALHRHLDKLYLPGNGNRIQRYGLVIILVVVFFLIKTSLVAIFEKNVPFLFSTFIVILSAWYGGAKPGILATLLTGVISDFLFLEPRLSISRLDNIHNIIILFIFLIEGFVISILSDSHRRSDTQKNEFIGVISHELKNPLTSIKGYAEMIKKLGEQKGDKKVADFAARMDIQINQVIGMVNEMLDVTKIETGHFTYRSEEFPFFQLVKEIVADQQVTTDTHKIYFSGKTNKQINGDRYRIGQVITNLISNAIKYSPGKKKITIKVENKRGGVIVSVQDFGSGIAIEDQAKLFEPFFRAKNSGSAKGTGIGLFISSQIVQNHKGKLWVESKLGKGSTFYLFLPAK